MSALPPIADITECGPTRWFFRSLFQLIADLIETRVGTAIVKFGAGCAARTDGSDDLVAKLDHHAAAEKHDVWQLGKWRNRILPLGALGQGKCIVFERNGGIRFIVGAIERVNASAVATQRHNNG